MCSAALAQQAAVLCCAVAACGAPVLCWHTQQDTAIADRHEVGRLDAAGSASNESRSLDHLLLMVMHTLVGAQWRRRTHECSRSAKSLTATSAADLTGACRRVVAVLPS